MPYSIRKLPNKPLYRVRNKDTGEIHSYGTTLNKAKAQVRLLESLKKRKIIKKNVQFVPLSMRRTRM